MLLKRLLMLATVFVPLACGTGFEESDSSSDVGVNVSAGQIDVAVGATFNATFSAEIDAATVTNTIFFIVADTSAASSLILKSAAIDSQCNPDNAISGTISCAADGLSCTLTLDVLLEVETSYILCLTSDIQFANPQLNGIFEGISHEFITQNGPEVAEDQTDIAIGSTFEHTFETAVDTTTVTTETFFVVPTTVEVVLNAEDLDTECLVENALPGTVSCAADGLTCTLTLEESLSYDSWYIFCVTDDIVDYDGSATAYKTQSASRFSVSGTLTGLSGAVVLQNNGRDDLTLNADGEFTFPATLADAATYEATVKTNPTSPNQTCTVSNGSGTIAGANITNVSVVCSAADTYTVGGTITGLSGTLVLRNNSGDDLTLTNNNAWTFATAVADGAGYAVTVKTQPSGLTCSVSSGAGTISGANVANVSVVCSANSFTVGGTLSGLSGTVVLQNNAGNNLSLTTNGSFTFTTSVAHGSAYAVTVLTQPSIQTCTVATGSGTISGANVTTVAVTCVNKTWSHQAYLKAPNTTNEDQFGISVAIDTDTIAVGAYLEDSTTTGIINGSDLSATNDTGTNNGAVYVYIRQ